MSDPKLVNKSPNPDKLKNKQDIEEKWAQSILSKNGEEADEAFTKELDKFKNPIQIWIKAQVLDNLGMPSADSYKKKAVELGYSTESIIEESVNMTNFADGTTVFSTKDPILADKIKMLINENLKQEFQYSGEQQLGPWTWNMFHEGEDLKVDKKEYNRDALIQLIHNDTFLKFNFHNLSTNDIEKDLDFMWTKYVKGDPAYSRTIKTYESTVSYYAEKQSTKYDFYNRLSKLLESAKILDKVNIADVCTVINQFTTYSILEKIQVNSKVELKNILSDLKTDGIIESLNKSQLTFKEFDGNLATAKLQSAFNVSEQLAYVLYSQYLLPILKESLDFYHIGNKEFTSLFNIMSSIILTNELK